jgi:hypothetical protein
MLIERVLAGRDHTRARYAPGLDACANRLSLKARRQCGPHRCKLMRCRRDHSHHRRLDPFCATTLHRSRYVGERRQQAR